ncbi:MAG: tetratricopeptide repeat protein [Bacteroidetes bacterium]|nr:MAG: tetratricopeptide repeat protein [Bacteroidota bacterium]TAE72892.1 MAG: tetratricopeptide repeat protein [Bacteroidota bacterium]TAF94033.1 MAG: tetratricopeptide repeat protein [Bacteroidota bacterium]
MAFFIQTMRSTIFAFIIAWLSILPATGQQVLILTPGCQQALKQIFQLQIQAGKDACQQERTAQPQNIAPQIIECYALFFEVFFNEDAATHKLLKQRHTLALEALDALPANNPYRNYFKSALHLQKAVIGIKFNEKVAAAFDIRKAGQYIQQNVEQFPQFAPNKVIQGPVQVAAGVVPDGYKWIANLLGIKGSVKNGMMLIRQALSQTDAVSKLLHNEVVFYYCYLSFYVENKPDEVIQFIAQQKLDLVNNHLFAYLASNLCLNSKRSEQAKQIITNRSKLPGYLETPVWNLALGNAALYKLDYTEAITQYQQFVQQFQGGIYLKDAYQRMAWCYLLQGNTKAATEVRKQVLTKGSSVTDADKKALKDAKTNTWPNTVLLKARLLNDGGFFRPALAVLHGLTAADFTSIPEQLEFYYRVGRIYDDLQKDTEAIQFYEKAIQLGKYRPEYFAARAALQIGILYEKNKQFTQAIAYYEMCLAMDDHDYKDSLDQKAKAGIARCKNE